MQKNTKLVSKVILIKGILITLLGILHIVGTFTFEADNIAGKGTAEFQRDYLVWFCGVGGFILFMGLVDILCYKSLKRNALFAWQISLLCALFTILLGLPGVIIFGISPPLLLLVVGLIAIVTLLLNHGKFYGHKNDLA